MPFRQQLLWPKQLDRIRSVALLAMVQTVTIYRRSDAPAPSPDVDYGDDALSFIETLETKRGQVQGWVESTPTPIQEVDTGAVVTANTYRLYVPVGTDIQPGDHVVIGSAVENKENDYTVSDTTQENTWSPMLICTLRHRE